MAPEGMSVMPSTVSSTIELKIRGVVFREGDQYVVQGLEYDICAFGKTLEKAQERFQRSLLSTAMHCLTENKECMADIPAAPQKYWEMFKTSGVRVELVAVEDEPLRTPIMPPPAIKPMLRFAELPEAA